MPFVIPPAIWRDNVRGVVSMLADKNFQRSAWFEPGPKSVFPPDELIGEFFDELFFDEFLTSDDVRLSEQQRLKGKRLLAALQTFCDSFANHLDPSAVFHDLRWDEIRRLATDFLADL
jgi:hypothetical protein